MKIRIAIPVVLLIAVAWAVVAIPLDKDPPAPTWREVISNELADEASDVAALQLRLQSTGDSAEALDLVRAIETRKRETRVHLLQKQLQWARRDGDADAVEQIETALAAERPGGKR